MSMSISTMWPRVHGRYQRAVQKYLCRRVARIAEGTPPYISFTYDDFPRSALQVGGAILSDCGVTGTYYVSLGLLGADAPTGKICSREDIELVLTRGHELGCHTFGHCHSWETSPSEFEASIIENRAALSHLVPGATFESMAYPISGPRYDTKRRVGKYFRCCRGGGQTYNVGTIDLNLLNAFFLEKSRADIDSIMNLIDATCQVGGWLIFATHDVSSDPTPYGCTPNFLQAVVEYSLRSGAKILPVARVLDSLFGEERKLSQ